MSVNYLTSVPLPEIATADALFNEIHYLKSLVGGELMSFYPYKKRGKYFPWQLAGFPQLWAIKAAERRTHLHHIYTPQLTAYPFFFALKKPIILSVVGNLTEGLSIPSPIRLRNVQRIVVANERDRAILEQHQVKNVRVIKTGITIGNLRPQKLPLQEELVLLMASAPWNMEQFHIKGIHLLLKTLQQMEQVKIIFIWRDFMFEHLQQLVQKYEVANKVILVNQKVDINTYLAKAHGAILLCNKGGIVKSSPHSLIESLLVNKPIITNGTVPLADLVKQKECGIIPKDFSINSLVDALNTFRQQYAYLVQQTISLDKQLFSIDRMGQEYKALYQQVIAEHQS